MWAYIGDARRHIVTFCVCSRFVLEYNIIKRLVIGYCACLEILFASFWGLRGRFHAHAHRMLICIANHKKFMGNSLYPIYLLHATLLLPNWSSVRAHATHKSAVQIALTLLNCYNDWGWCTGWQGRPLCMHSLVKRKWIPLATLAICWTRTRDLMCSELVAPQRGQMKAWNEQFLWYIYNTVRWRSLLYIS